jgi:hypothetical protein
MVNFSVKEMPAAGKEPAQKHMHGLNADNNNGFYFAAIDPPNFSGYAWLGEQLAVPGKDSKDSTR